jgi:predicted HTH transcriptional regulator
MQTLRRIWRNYKTSKNWHILISELDIFLKEKPLNEEKESMEFDERKLKLICVDFISWGRKMFKISDRAALDEINKLLKLEVLKPQGKGRGLHYILK